MTAAKLARARALLYEGCIVVGYADAPNVLYVQAEVAAGAHTARAIIAGDYTNFVEVARNGRVTFAKPLEEGKVAHNALAGSRLRELFTLIETMTPEELAFLIDAARVNKQAAEKALQHPAMKLGPALNARAADLPAPFAAMHRAQMLVAAAVEARMYGLKVPIMAIAGSGDQGICNFLGVLGAAEVLGSAGDALGRALAFSSTVTVFIQTFTARMTAFCGGAVSVATGVAGAVTYLLGGTFEDAILAMQTMIGTQACILCDGAKESCAYKLGNAAATAVHTAYLALDGVSLPQGEGIVGHTIEDTFKNLGALNNQGMVETDRLILRLIEKSAASVSAGPGS
jgi:L-cysteine desulfidase